MSVEQTNHQDRTEWQVRCSRGKDQGQENHPRQGMHTSINIIVLWRNTCLLHAVQWYIAIFYYIVIEINHTCSGTCIIMACLYALVIVPASM